MATYQITTPNGETYKVTGPPGASREDLIRQLEAQQDRDKHQYGDDYQYQSEDINPLVALKDTAVGGLSGIYKAASGLVSIGSLIPGEVPFTDWKLSKPFDYVAEALYGAGTNVDELMLSDRQKEINEELSVRLERAAGELGPDASTQDYIDAIMAQGGEAGKFIGDHPWQAVNLVVQSLPYIFGGGVLGTGVKTAAKGASFAASKYGLTKTKAVTDKVANMSNIARVSAGEGGISMGANLQQVIAQSDGEVNMLDRYKTVPGGVFTGLVARGGAGVAQKFGLRDVDLLLGGKKTVPLAGATSGSAVRNVALGTAIEGGEEFFQSAGEKISENWALDKNLLTDVGGETVLGTVAGLTQGGAVNIVRQTAKKDTTEKVDDALEEELENARTTKKEEIQQQIKADAFVQGATAVNTPEELAVFAAQQGVSVEEIQANPEFQRIQEEKAAGLEEEIKKANRTKHAKTFPNEKDWIKLEKEDIYQQRRAEISNPETELGQAFDAWTEDDDVVLVGKLDRDEVTDLPSEVAVKGFIKDNPSLFDNTLATNYKTALEEHAAVQEDKVVNPSTTKQYNIFFQDELTKKNAALERGDLPEAARIEADIASMRTEDPLIVTRWNEFKRKAAVEAEQAAKEAKASKKKPKVGTTDQGATDQGATDQGAIDQGAIDQGATQTGREEVVKPATTEVLPEEIEQQEMFDELAGPTQPAEELVVEPEQEVAPGAFNAPGQAELTLQEDEYKLGSKASTRWGEAVREFERAGEDAVANHPDLFDAIEAYATDKVYDKKIKEAREKQKLIDSGKFITDVGARTRGDFNSRPGTWPYALIEVLEKASRRGTLNDYVSFKSTIKHRVKKGDTRESIAEKYNLKVEDIFPTEEKIKTKVKVKGTGVGKIKGTGTDPIKNPIRYKIPPRYTIEYREPKKPKALGVGKQIDIPMSRKVMDALPIEDKYKAAEWASSAIAEEIIATNEWAKGSTPERGKKNVNNAFTNYRRKHITVGKLKSNPRELMDRFLERTAFADAYSGSAATEQQVEDYRQDSAYVDQFSAENVVDTGTARTKEEYIDEKGNVIVSQVGESREANTGVQVLDTPQDFKEGTEDDFAMGQELRNLEAEVTKLLGDATRAETKAKKSPTQANKVAATKKRALADDIVARIDEINIFKAEDKPGKIKKQRAFNEKDSLPAGQVTKETDKQAKRRHKERVKQAENIVIGFVDQIRIVADIIDPTQKQFDTIKERTASAKTNLEQGKVIEETWNTNKKIFYTPSFKDLTPEQKREWAATVLLAVHDNAIPDIPNQQRLMEDRFNAETKSRAQAQNQKVVAGRGKGDTVKSKPKPAVKPSRRKGPRKVSSKNAAENYAKEKLAPIYGPRWRGHQDLVILKTHLKNQDWAKYQRFVDKKAKEAQPIEVKAVINGETQTIKIYQPDLFDKTKEANKESKERFEVLYRKLLGEKDYRKIKNRIFFYETTADMFAAGWVGDRLDQSGAWVVPKGVNNDEPLMVFVLEKIKTGDELQIFMHEVGSHVGLEGVLSEEGVKKLAKRIQKLYEEDMAKYGNEDFYTDTMEQALARSPVVRADSEAHFMARHAIRGALSPGYRDETGTVPQDTLDSESIAFFVQAAVAIGADPTETTEAGSILKKFIDAMKKFLNIAVGNTDFNMSAQDVAAMAWGAGRLKLKGGSDFTRMISRLEAMQTSIKGKFKMSIKEWSNSIDAAARRNYPKNDKGKYVPHDGSFVKDWGKYQAKQFREENDFRTQAKAQAESIIKQAEEHERSLFDPDNKNPKRSFSFNRPPLNEEEKARSKEEHSRIRELIASQISEEAAYQYDTMANLASNAVDSTKFLHEFIYEHRNDLPAGVTFMDLIDKAETMRNNIKQTVDDIAIQARDLSPDRQVVVDRIIAFGTQEQAWPADPGMKNKSVAAGNVVINKKFEAVFKKNLNKAEQKLVMDVYRHGEKMLALKRAILELLGLDKDSDFLGITALDGPYAPLRRTGKHSVILKSKTYVELEKLYKEGSTSTSTSKKKNLKAKLDDLQSEPKHYSYSYFITKGEARKYYNKQIATGKWDTSKDGSKYTPKARPVGQGREPDKKVFDKVLSAMGTSSLDDASKLYVEELLKKMYMESMEETNARQGEGKRKGRGVHGFDTNMLNSFVDNAKSEANLLANMKFGKEINVTLSKARQEATDTNDSDVMEVYNMIVVHYNLMLNAKDTSVFNSVASFTTAMVLTTSLGYHLQNATQPWAVSYPLLAADFNDWKAVTPALSRGYRIASSLISYDGKVPFIQWNKPATWQTEVNLEQIPRWVTHHTNVKGTGDLTGKKLSKEESAERLKMWTETIKPLLLAMQEAKLLDLGIEQDLSSSVTLKKTGFKTLDAVRTAGGKISHRLYQMPRMVEAYNRIATGIAAVEMAQNHRNGAKVMKVYDTDPTAYAVRLVRRTQGDFTANDAPAAIKYITNNVPAGKLMVQFKKFGMMMGWAHVEAWKQLRKGLTHEERVMGRRAAAYLIAHTVVLSGVRGLPFISYFTMLTFLLGTGDDDDYDPNTTEGLIERKLMELFPDNLDLAKAIARGPFNLLGVDTHTKLSQANIFSLMPFTDFEMSSEGFKDIGFGIFGASGANALNIGRGFEFMAEGNYYRGVESMLFKGGRSLMESWRLGTEGYTSSSGDVGAPPDTIGKFQLLLNGLGIPASDIVDLKWTNSEQFQIRDFFETKQRRIKNAYQRAHKKNDQKKMKKLVDEWIKLQDAKDRVRPFFNNAPSAIKRTSVRSLTLSPGRQVKTERKFQQRLGTDKGSNYNLFTGVN